jgi:DNA-binding transcriptional LysR family regulator
MSKLEQINAFIAVAEAGSFAAAARKLGVSTAAISRQVARLEAELNIELLRRTTRQVSLTETGSQYFQDCKKALNELAEAEQAITSSQQEASGILTVTSSRYFAMKYLLPRLPDFMKLNPALQVRLELAERFPNLAAENIDVLFGVSMEGPAELVRKKVAVTRYVLCASPEYLEKAGTPVHPADLKQHRYITHSMRVPDYVLSFRDNRQVTVDPILWLNDSRAMRECAMMGMGIVKLHDYIVNDALREKRLVEILREFQEPQEYVYLYYKQSRYLQAKIRRFIDFYTETVNPA